MFSFFVAKNRVKLLILCVKTKYLEVFAVFRSVLVFLCFVHTSFFCAADISTENQQKVKNVLAGLDDSKMRLNSGVCRIVGSSLRDIKSLDDNITIAFDYSKGFYRFDQGEDNRSLRTPDYYYEYLKEYQMVTRQSAQTRSSAREISPFDIRNLGFFNFVGPYWNEEYAKIERTKLLSDKPISFEESNGIFVVSVERTPNVPGHSFPPIIRKYWIDSKQGFSMVRAEFGGRDSTEISWKEINEIWVPTSFKLSSTQTPQSAEWKIEWSFVNEDVPEDYFDPTLLSDKATILVSKELDQPIILGKIAKGHDLPGPLYVPEDHVFFPFRYIPMYLGIFLIVLGLGKMTYDYWRKQTPR